MAVGLAIALTITWSRVYLGVHFPKDVLVGGALGWLAAEIVARLAARVGLMHRMHRMHRVRRLRRRRLAAAAAGA